MGSCNISGQHRLICGVTKTLSSVQWATLDPARFFAVGAAKPKKVDRGEGGMDDARIQHLLKMMETKEVKLPKMGEKEELEAREKAKEFSRRKMRQHREWQAEFSTRRRLAQAALAALPDRLKEAAMQPMEPPPPRKPFPTDSPPLSWRTG